jgi:hypothetical protein
MIDVMPVVPIHELLSNDEFTLYIKVSELSDWRRVFLVVVHELCEVGLCVNDGVSQATVDAFDKGFEGDRERVTSNPAVSEYDKCLADIAEPGDHPNAPYRKQHCFATAVERMLAAALDVNWHDYELELEALP